MAWLAQRPFRIARALSRLTGRQPIDRAGLRRLDATRLMGAAVEEASDLVVILSPDGRVQHANRAFCAAVALDAGDLIGRAISRVLAEESLSKLGDIEAAAGGRAWNGTLAYRRADGSAFQAACTVVPLTDRRGDVTHYVHMARDITEELRMRGQLIHSERLSAVGQLVSGVAHELNNPLQSILGFTELLIDAEERPHLRRDLEHVRSEAIRAGKIVKNLLAFVRRSSSERTMVNVNDIVKTTLSLRSYEFGSSNIRLFESYAEGLPQVRVNPEEVQQVILNLILNAEQAMRQAHRGGTMTVSTDLIGDMVAVDIRDDGPGVPATLAGRIFEPFFSTKEVGEGTGLGLSIAMGIAEAHGGRLSLVPVDKGACFRLSLPASGGEHAAPQPAVIGSAAGSFR